MNFKLTLKAHIDGDAVVRVLKTGALDDALMGIEYVIDYQGTEFTCSTTECLIDMLQCLANPSRLEPTGSASGMGAASPAEGAGDGQDNTSSEGKAGPAEVPVGR